MIWAQGLLFGADLITKYGNYVSGTMNGDVNQLIRFITLISVNFHKQNKFVIAFKFGTKKQHLHYLNVVQCGFSSFTSYNRKFKKTSMIPR